MKFLKVAWSNTYSTYRNNISVLRKCFIQTKILDLNFFFFHKMKVDEMFRENEKVYST